MLSLNLFHGRATPDEELDDWGSDGPVLGPFSFIQVTYGSHIKLGFLLPDGSEPPPEQDWLPDLCIDEGVVFYDGVYYGDFTIKAVQPADLPQLTPIQRHVLQPQPQSTTP